MTYPYDWFDRTLIKIGDGIIKGWKLIYSGVLWLVCKVISIPLIICVKITCWFLDRGDKK